jgi:hypothetical protein
MPWPRYLRVSIASLSKSVSCCSCAGNRWQLNGAFALVVASVILRVVIVVLMFTCVCASAAAVWPWYRDGSSGAAACR